MNIKKIKLPDNSSYDINDARVTSFEGEGLQLNSGVLSVKTASTTVTGAVKIGSGIDVTAGVISTNAVPKNGQEGQVLTYKDGGASWEDASVSGSNSEDVEQLKTKVTKLENDTKYHAVIDPYNFFPGDNIVCDTGEEYDLTTVKSECVDDRNKWWARYTSDTIDKLDEWGCEISSISVSDDPPVSGANYGILFDFPQNSSISMYSQIESAVQFFELKKGTYTVSLYIKNLLETSEFERFHSLYLSCGEEFVFDILDVDLSDLNLTPNTWVKVVKTFTTTEDYKGVYFALTTNIDSQLKVVLSGIKLEMGEVSENNVTWTPYPFSADNENLNVGSAEVPVYIENGVVKPCNGFATNPDIIDPDPYGVQWDSEQADPQLIRIGSMNNHKVLPIQSKMKGCIYNPIQNKVVYWLDDDDWTYKKGGNPNKGETEQLARLDGYDGEVFVYVPEFWIKSHDGDDTKWVQIAPVEQDNSWEHQPATYVAAYQSQVLSSTVSDMGYLSTLQSGAAVSVCNTSSSLNNGYPSNNQTRASFRTAARKAGKEIMSYTQYKNILYWLYVIEYANFNSQAEFSEELTAEGYHKGGLGAGLTDYSSHTPNKNGITNTLGNKTGIKPVSAGSTHYAIKWRGIENPFGNLWNFVDGVIIDASNTSNGKSKVFVATDTSKYNDSDTSGYILAGLQAKYNDYVREFDLGTSAQIIPTSIGGSGTLYKCDYNYYGADGLQVLMVGGSSGTGAGAGLAYFHSGNSASHAYSSIGFRASCVA